MNYGYVMYRKKKLNLTPENLKEHPEHPDILSGENKVHITFHTSFMPEITRLQLKDSLDHLNSVVKEHPHHILDTPYLSIFPKEITSTDFDKDEVHDHPVQNEHGFLNMGVDPKNFTSSFRRAFPYYMGHALARSLNPNIHADKLKRLENGLYADYWKKVIPKRIENMNKVLPLLQQDIPEDLDNDYRNKPELDRLKIKDPRNTHSLIVRTWADAIKRWGGEGSFKKFIFDEENHHPGLRNLYRVLGDYVWGAPE